MENPVTNLVEFLSENLGAGDKVIRLLLSLFAGYPLAFIYRSFIFGSPKNVQHAYFITCGLVLAYFNFGGDTIHSVINIVVIWALIQVLGGTGVSVALAFIFNTTYLLCGYYDVSSEEYDISWATPHCVLILRLTGVVYDLYDGRKDESRLSSEQKETYIKKKPSLLEMAGHVYYFGGFLVGPQFSIRRYLSFIDGVYRDSHTNGPPKNIPLALVRMLLGVAYIAAFQIFNALIFDHKYMLSDQFRELGFVYKCVLITIWGKLTIGKYVGCWLVAEGSCMLTGLTYNGKDINGNSLWDGCTNAKIYQLESSSNFREMIAGFNVNTNNWMSRYVFKRLKFLGNKQLSQVATLTYLAVWHGLHAGYYMNFFLEFIMLNGETQLSEVLQRFPSVHHICSLPPVKPLAWCIKKFFLQFFVSYALVSFVHLDWGRISQVYQTVNYIGHVTFIVVPVLCLIIKALLPKPFRSREKVATNGVHTNSGAHENSVGTTKKES